MSHHVLHLRTLMNRPDRIDMALPVMALDAEQPPALLLLSEPLIKAVLKCDVIVPTDLVANLKTSARLEQNSLPAIGTFFSKTPMLMNGVTHREVRMGLQPIYRIIEDRLDSWLPDYAQACLQSAGPQNRVSAFSWVSGFLDGVNRRIMAVHVGCPVEHLPPLPNQLYRLLPRAEDLIIYDQSLQALVSFLAEQLSMQQRDPDEAWALVSVAVMGQESLLSGLLFSMVKAAPQGHWTAESLMRESAPVSMLGCRQVQTDVELEGVKFLAGQLLYVCPFLTHLSMRQGSCAPTSASSSYSFGSGAHVCAGRKIALKIVQAFLDAHQQCSPLNVNQQNLRFFRDINLMVQQHV